MTCGTAGRNRRSRAGGLPRISRAGGESRIARRCGTAVHPPPDLHLSRGEGRKRPPCREARPSRMFRNDPEKYCKSTYQTRCLAEGEGFEPSVRFVTVLRFSKPPPSTSRPSLRSRSGRDVYLEAAPASVNDARSTIAPHTRLNQVRALPFRSTGSSRNGAYRPPEHATRPSPPAAADSATPRSPGCRTRTSSRRRSTATAPRRPDGRRGNPRRPPA